MSILACCLSGVLHGAERSPTVDLEKYMGTWYEIAAVPQPFEYGCTCVKAEYTMVSKGAIEVRNSCLRKGILDEVVGIARVIDPFTRSHLAVKFPSSPEGSYNIIGLDPDYQFAIVSGGGDSLWILARDRKLQPDLLGQAIEIAASKKDLTGLRFTDQRNCDTF